MVTGRLEPKVTTKGSRSEVDGLIEESRKEIKGILIKGRREQ